MEFLEKIFVFLGPPEPIFLFLGQYSYSWAIFLNIPRYSNIPKATLINANISLMDVFRGIFHSIINAKLSARVQNQTD